MATWFAQLTNTNINTANMWNSVPAGGGAVLTWPPDTGDILVANGKLVRLNVSTTVAEIQNDSRGGATEGGQFQFNKTGVSLAANAHSAVAQGGIGLIRVTLASGAVFFVGNLYGGAPDGARCLFMSNGIATTVNITGNLYAGSGSGSYALITSGTHSGAINITGDIYGSSASNVAALRHETGGTIAMTGNAIAQAGPAVELTATGSNLSVSGYAQGSAAQTAISNVGQGIVTVGEARSASNGRGAVTGAFRYASATAAKSMPYTPDGQISMTVLDVAAIVPAEADVRKGLVYGDGAYTGTLQLGRNRTSMAGRF